MSSEDFEKLVDKKKYQVFLFTCPCSFPISFVSHTWFVVNKNGELSRWEILHKKNMCKTSWGHLHQNVAPFTRGLGIFSLTKGRFWKSRLLGKAEGDENSFVKKMIEKIESARDDAMFCYNYSFLGRNSNTFVQKILNSFPEFSVKLPWSCLGKNFRK